MLNDEKKKRIESLSTDEMLFEINLGHRSRFQRDKFAYLKTCYQKRLEEKKQSSSKQNMATNETSDKDKIFLSYSWKNSAIADYLDILFKTKNITLNRDVRDVEYRQSIKKFMKQIRSSDFCLVVISEDYLKSINCMFEVTEFLKEKNYKDRILPLVQKDANIFDIKGINIYIKFWQDKFIELKKSSSDIDELNRIETINELKKIENIQRNIGDFLSIISDMKTIIFDNEIDVTDFNKIYSVINPNDSFLGEHHDVDGFFLLNVPRTLISKVFTWMAKESKGYTFELNNAKIYTKNEIDQKVNGDAFQAEWFCKKYAAIPINELAIKLGQNYIPYDHRFLEILRKHRNKIVGNTAIHLTKEEIEQYG
ncbi:MAG: toll/interleukin-1 receptor domain-containing protein [Coriobacteriia bacterium]|nr:toll/interleukin-1 receptor domain-containing protein [Coriobacteriia bacterium]